MSSAVVLLSAGLDSTINLYQAIHEQKTIHVLSFDYGQRAARKEIEQAQKICAKLQVPWKLIPLSFFSDFGGSSLTSDKMEVPVGARVDIQSMQVSKESAKSVWVPNRNGVFLNIAAAYAESIGATEVIPGFNKEEAATFPDNTEEFMKRTSSALQMSTANQVKISCATSGLDKSEIVKMGLGLKVDFSQIWPCYFANVKWCGKCESCQRSLRALKANGISITDWVA